MNTHPLEALAEANARRLRQAAVHRALAAGAMPLADALADPAVRSLAVWRVVAWVPRFGPWRAERLLARIEPWPVDPARLCGELTSRQREAIECAVNHYFRSRP